MTIVVVIPILYTQRNRLYLRALKNLTAAWKKGGRQRATLEVIMVVNGLSAHQSLPFAPHAGLKITVLINVLNRGFTGAVNDGVWAAVFQKNADWVLVLNDDAFVDGDFFAAMIPQLTASRAIITCGVRNSDGSLQSAGLAYYPTGLASPLTRFVDSPYFSGTVFFVSAATARWSIEQFGWLLPEFFFAYAEDLELSLRLKRAGKKVFIFPKILVTHLGSVTAKRGSAFQLYWGFRNLLMVALLHWPIGHILGFMPLLMLGQLYVLALLLSKGYWLVYPKILWSLWKNRGILAAYRKALHETLPFSHSF